METMPMENLGLPDGPQDAWLLSRPGVMKNVEVCRLRDRVVSVVIMHIGMDGSADFADLNSWKMHCIESCRCMQILASLNIGAWAYMMLPIEPGQANPMLQASRSYFFPAQLCNCWRL